jgi:LCP family protein required for cell wall assembly
MKSSRAAPSTHSDEPKSPDRLTKALVIAALGLFAIVAALSVDLWLAARDSEKPSLVAEQASPAVRPTSLTPPTAAPSPVPVTPPPCVAPEDWTVHTIQEGDTLYALATQYGTEVETLMRVNCLESNTILVGQALRVPGPPTVATALDAPVGQPAVAASNEGAAAQPTAPGLDLQAGFPKKFLNIALLGSDREGPSTTWRTDTIIIVSVDTESDFVGLLSIPRDLWVNIPGHGPDRINTADLWGEVDHEGGGPETVKQTIYQNLGIPIHYYVRVDFKGFTKIIDAVGGLDIDVECPLPDIELTTGLHHMDGELALKYARSRMSTSDFDRSRRQRKLLMALWEQGLSVSLIPRLPSLSKAMADTIQTDIPFDQVVALAYKGLQLKPGLIFAGAIGPWQVENWTTPEGALVLLPVDEEIQALLEEFYGQADMAFRQSLGNVRIMILNGSQRTDAERMAGTTLRWEGFKIAHMGAADNPYYAESQVLVYDAEPKAAEAAAQALNLPRSSLEYQPDPSQSVNIRIILGADFDPCK